MQLPMTAPMPAEQSTSPAAPARSGPTTLKQDLVAGLTTAMMLVPQSMAYAMLAGLPPIVGLYASTLPLLVYALVGSSPFLAVGPVAIDSMLTAAALAPLAAQGSPEYVAYAALLAGMVGLVQVAMGTLRLGYLTNFISLPVLTGFTAAASIAIGLSQVPPLLGVGGARGQGTLALIHHVVTSLPKTKPATLVLGLLSIAALELLRKKRPQFPRALVVAIAASVLVLLVPFFRDVATVGTIPQGLPPFRLPTLDRSIVESLAPSATTLALIAFLEAFSVSKAFAEKSGHEPMPNREFGALGAANVAASLVGGYPITGGLSRSAVNANAGAKSKLAGAITATVVLLALVLLTPLFARIPKAALAAIVVTSIVALVDVPTMKRLYRVKRSDFGMLAATFAVTLGIGFTEGILFGVALSIGFFLYETTKPHVAVLGQIPGTTVYRNVARYPQAVQVPGFLIVRVDAQFYFGNVTFLRETLARLEAESSTRIHAVVLDASAVNNLDSSAEAALDRVFADYEKRGIDFAVASVKGPVRDVMKNAGLWQRLGKKRLYFDVHDAVEHLRARDELAEAASP